MGSHSLRLLTQTKAVIKTLVGRATWGMNFNPYIVIIA